MNDDGIFKQRRFENEALLHTNTALLDLLSWPIEGDTYTRKLSGVRFLTGWFQQQVERLFAIEERDGYMTYVREALPQLTERIQSLQAEHHEIRDQLAEIVVRLERVLPNSLSSFDALCEELKALLSRLKQHTENETEMLQDALTADIGGEGG